MHISTSVPNLLLLCKKAILQTRFLLTLALLWISAVVMGQTTETFSTAGTYTWVCPPGVTSIQVECWGAGGGSGGVNGISAANGGGGGAGGGYVRNTSYTVTPGVSYTLFVGTGGAAGASGGSTNGQPGESSYFISSATINAVGGNGGASRTTAGYGTGGSKVTSGNVGFSSTFSYYGGSGGTGSSSTTSGGGGGGSAGTGSDGNNASARTGGSLVTGGSAGRDGTASFGSGLAGNSPGGGAGGAYSSSTTSYGGGKGGDGQVRLTYTTPTYTTVTLSTAGTSTWTVPCGVTAITVEAWGGGGGGGSSNNTGTNGGSGGGGGAYSKSNFGVTPSTTCYYTVGARGAGGPASSTTAPDPGGDSWFNLITNAAPTSTAGLLAKGGGAGANNSLTAPLNGGSSDNSFANVVKYRGGHGAAGTSSGGGGGGSSAGTGAIGGGASGTTAGTAPTGGGGGGAGSITLDGSPGSNPGGGGGGSDDVATRKGGDGGVGQIIISYVTPTVPTAAVISSPSNSGTNIAATGTTLNWTNGGGTATYNVYFGTDNPPTNIVNGTNQAGTSYDPGTLSSNQTYYWRVDAVDASGCNTTTGTVWSFTTAAAACSTNPTISTTTAVSSIGATSASSGGSTITAGTNCSITAKGVCYGTSSSPTISGSKTNEGTGTADFSSSLTGLTAGTLYYARAYVTNSFGTSYGNEISFRTLSAELSSHPASFTATANGSSQIDLSFSAASTISANGYLILQKQGSNPGFTPVDATAYTVGATVATGETVAAIITNTASTSTSITGLSTSTAYNFSIIPFTYDGANAATYNYYTAATILTTNATTTSSTARYAVADGNWNGSIWAATSGGVAGSASAPGASDDVFIVSGADVTVTVSASCGSITFTGATASLVINSNQTLTVSGDVGVNHLTGGLDAEITISGAGTLVAGSVSVGKSSPSSLTSNRNTRLITSVENLSISGNITLTAYRNSNNREPYFEISGGTVILDGTINPIGIAFSSLNIYFRMTGGGSNQKRLVLNNATPWNGHADLMRPWGNRTTSGYSIYNVELTGTNATVVYNASGAQTILRSGNTTTVTVNHTNLTIAGSGNKTIPTLASTLVSGILSVQGTAALVTTGTFSYGASATLEYKNAPSRTTSNTEFPSSSGPLNLIIDNSGNTTTLHADRTIAGTLTLTAGIVATGSNTLTVGVNGTISGASSSGYISGKLAWVFPSSGTNVARTFPVGKSGNYRPATFTYATASSQTVTIENFASATPLSLSTASTANFGSGYWNISQSATGTNYTVGLNNGGVTATTGGTVVMLRREGTGSATSNAISFSSPTYTNSSAFSTSNASNDVMLAETSIPLTITGVTANNKIYDGNTTATLNVVSAALSGVVGSDVVTLSSGSAAGTFSDKNVGTGKTVTTSGFSLSGANAGAYTLTQPSTTANITAKGLTATLTGTVSKTYDGTTTATLSTSNYSLTGIVGSEDVTVTNTSGSYNNKNVGTSKMVTVNSPLTLGGTDAGNYSISGNATGTVGTITARALTITGASNSKIYDGGTSSATVPAITSGALQGSDVAAFTQTYDNKNVGTSKVMTPSGVVTDGNSGNNYSYTFVTSSNGTITAKGLTASLTGTVSKSYDGTTTATLTTANYNLTGVETGDVVTVTNTSGSYDNKNVGTSKTVTVSSPLTLGGAAAGNYTISGSAIGTVGAITAKALTASLTGIVTKTYDANTTATLTSANYSLTGVVGSEDVTVTNTSGTYDNKNVGTGKTVTVTSLNLGGADESNYSISGNATGAVGVITKKELTITANNQNVLFGTAVATVTSAGSYTTTGFVGGETSSVINGTVNYTTNYTNTTAAGTPGVTITPVVTGLSATNYSFTPANGTITITVSSKTWVGQGLDKTGNWNEAVNWLPSGVPNNSLHSIVINEGTPTMDVNYTVVSGKNLTISGTGALIIGAGRTLTIAGVADFGNRPVTLKSTSAGTASIGTISGTLSNATAVTVERYMTARRKWRALTAPLTGTSNNSIYANWQNNGTPTGTTGAIIWRPGSDEGTTGLYNAGSSASMLSLSSINTWTQMTNTKADGSLFTSGQNNAYMMFYTGPYNQIGTYVASGSLASTLSATGELRIGNVNFDLIGNWNMIGNPYASAIRTDLLSRGGNLNNNGYIWNPGGAGTGVFTPITLNTASIIQSGQAFFVYSSNGSTGNTLGFTEAAKVSSSSNSVFRTEENSYDGDLKIELNKYIAGSPELSDVAIVNYKSRSEVGLPKLAQFFENMSIYQDNLDYGMTTRTINDGEDYIQLRLWQMNKANYQIKIDLRGMRLPAGSTAVLKDAFLNKEVSLSTTDVNKVDFNVTSEAASTGQRFSVVLRRANVPLTSTETPRFQIYPNPVVKGTPMQLEFRNKAAGKYTVTLFTIAGVRVQQDIIGHAGGTAVQSLKLSNLASGTYIAEISGGNGESEKVKVVVE